MLIRAVTAVSLSLMVATASFAAEDSNLQFSVGLGKQYGGNLGIKFSPELMGVRFNGGFGLMTMHLGMSVPFANRWELGVHGYHALFTYMGAGVHLNYHWNTYRRSGLVLGADVSREFYVGTTNHHYEDKVKALLSLGYHFF